jgi:hypothetical protein
MDTTRRIAEDLVHAIQKLRQQNDAHPGRHTAALHQLSTIFQEQTEQIARVDVPVTQTSTTPTATATVRAAPRRHTRRTRGNTPDTVPPITGHSTTMPPAPNLTRQHSEGAPRTKRLRTDIPPKLAPEKRRSPRLTPLAHGRHTRLNASPHIISQEALSAIAQDTYAHTTAINIDHFCAPVVHPITGETIMKYQKLAKDPIMSEVWTTAFGKEFGTLAQGDDKTHTPGTDSIFILDVPDIKQIPEDRTITYALVVVDYRPQKEDPNRVHITAGGNLIVYPGELTTRTADLTTSKKLMEQCIEHSQCTIHVFGY